MTRSRIIILPVRGPYVGFARRRAGRFPRPRPRTTWARLNSMSKDTMSKDSMSKDSMKKDTMSKDTMSKDSMKKDDGMSKDNMKK